MKHASFKGQVCVCLCARVHVCVLVPACVHVHMCVLICVCVRACAHMCVHVCMCFLVCKPEVDVLSSTLVLRLSLRQGLSLTLELA